METPKAAREFALALRKRVRGLSGVDVYLAPPFALIPEVVNVLESSQVHVGAQTLSGYESAAHTGDVSSAMLKSIGAEFVIVGHSERRALQPGSGQAAGESHDMVRAQLERAVAANLIPILCVGEHEHKKDGDHFSYVEEQLTSALKDISKNTMKKLIVAYEPVWAIGKSADDAMKPADVREMSIFIRKTLADLLDRAMGMKIPILYGGSVEAGNAHSLITEGGVSGFLVGHASASVEQFLAIIQACKN